MFACLFVWFFFRYSLFAKMDVLCYTPVQSSVGQSAILCQLYSSVEAFQSAQIKVKVAYRAHFCIKDIDLSLKCFPYRHVLQSAGLGRLEFRPRSHLEATCHRDVICEYFLPPLHLFNLLHDFN